MLSARARLSLSDGRRAASGKECSSSAPPTEQIYLAGNPAVAALRPATKKAEDTYLGRSVGAGNNVHGGITQVRSKTAAADSGRKIQDLESFPGKRGGFP